MVKEAILPMLGKMIKEKSSITRSKIICVNDVFFGVKKKESFLNDFIVKIVIYSYTLL
uniref:Uncharacterized protein n=1 Tax=Rhizophora mucronata TaxID=61149 RepID=A0A2P2IIB9_RHIMU